MTYKDPFNFVFDSFNFGDLGLRRNYESRRTDEGIELDVILPGLSRSDIKVGVENGTLRVSVEKQDESVQTTALQLYSGDRQSYFRQANAWQLPSDALPEQITARYEAGILRVFIPTGNEGTSRIEVQVE